MTNWHNFNWVDYGILALVGFSTLVSLTRGFVREALSLVIWIGAFWIAYQFATPFAQQFLQSIDAEGMRVPLAFVLLFLGVLILGAILSYGVGRLVSTTGLSGTDRVLGLIFGMARGLFLVAIMILIIPMTAINQSSWWQQSQLVPQFDGLTLYLHSMLPTTLSKLPVLTEKTLTSMSSQITSLKDVTTQQLLSP